MTFSFFCFALLSGFKLMWLFAGRGVVFLFVTTVCFCCLTFCFAFFFLRIQYRLTCLRGEGGKIIFTGIELFLRVFYISLYKYLFVCLWLAVVNLTLWASLLKKIGNSKLKLTSLCFTSLKPDWEVENDCFIKLKVKSLRLTLGVLSLFYSDAIVLFATRSLERLLLKLSALRIKG